MDISQIKPVIAKIVIVHPVTEEPIGLDFDVLPMSDPKVKGQIRTIRNKLLGKKRQKFTAKEEEENGIDLLTVIICGITWAKDTDWNGEKLEYSEANVRKIIEPDTSYWIRDQLQDQIGDTAGFFTKQPKNSVKP